MNILFLTKFFSPVGGGEYVFQLWARELAKRGHRIFVIRQAAADPPLEEDSINNVKVLSAGTSAIHAMSNPASNYYYLKYALSTGLKLVRTEKIELIHANEYTPTIVGAVLHKIKGTPCLVTIQDLYLGSLSRPVIKKYWKLQMSHQRIPDLLKAAGPLMLYLTVNAPVSAIHTVSESAKSNIRRLLIRRTPIAVIPNGLDLEEYDCCDHLYVNESTYFVYVGRLIPVKKMDVIIRAFKYIIEKNSEIKLYILGDGPMRQRLEKLAADLGLSDRVIFKGYVSDKEKINHLRNALGLVCPSLYETFGMSVIEAFATGTPALVSNVPNLNKLVTHGLNGFVIPTLAAEDWAKAMLYLAENKDLKYKLGANGKNIVKSMFKIEMIVDQLENLYRKLVDAY